MFSLNSRKILAKAAENWPAKVLSIAMALILFVFHRMSTMESRFFSVPLVVEVSPSLIPSSSYVRMVRVTLRGDANSVYPILEDDIEAFIDLKKYDAEGSYRAPVQIRKKGSAQGVEALEISVDPMEISLELDRKISKYVPLTANIRGTLAGGYDLISHTLTPTQVVVDGPMNILGGISELYTDFIDLDGKSEDFSVIVNILNRDPLLTIRGNGTTEFRGFVRRLVPVRNIDQIPILINGLDTRFSAETDVKGGSVRLEGSQGDLDRFVPPEWFLSVDCSLVDDPGTYTLPVQADLPPGLNLIRQDPQEVTVTIFLKNGGSP
jgi:YbbR domain-containing protein